MRMFRAQRNFYISGFSLFLSLVIRRLVILISSLATAQAQCEASLKQAQGASLTAKTLLESSGSTKNDASEKEVVALKEKVTSLGEELAKTKKDRDAIKKQAEATNSEYDRLTNEFSKLQKQLDSSAATTGGGDKKDD